MGYLPHVGGCSPRDESLLGAEVLVDREDTSDQFAGPDAGLQDICSVVLAVVPHLGATGLLPAAFTLQRGNRLVGFPSCKKIIDENLLKNFWTT
jgi:hypothetical protein